MTTKPTNAADRHHFVDALRGFALLGILLVNIEFILQPSEVGWSQFGSDLDLAARWTVIVFGQTKIYPIFATLFGYGLSLQLKRSGSELWPRYRRRMITLLGLGVVHGIFFFPGDILVIYAIVGLAAYRLRDTPTPRLLRGATWTYGLASGFWLIIGALDWTDGPAAVTSTIPSVFIDGSFFAVAGENFWNWVVTAIALSIIQGPAVVACFAVGLALGRTDLLANPSAHGITASRVIRWLPGGLVVAGIGGWLTLAVPGADTLGFALGFAAAPLVAAGYVALLARSIGGARGLVSRVLGASGRMSLTVYLLESVVTAFLAYGYGLGLMPSVGPVAGLAMAALIWAVLSAFSVAWMQRFRFGPFEWALRSVSYGSLQPLTRGVSTVTGGGPSHDVRA